VIFISILPGLIGGYRARRAKRYSGSPIVDSREF
jgi:hypothetical protein